jgi:hypothetical protein
VLSRLAGRLLTSPVAFFVAGLVDIGGFAFTALRASLRQRLGLALSRDH